MTADTPSMKAVLEKDTAWTNANAGSKRVQGYRFMAMAHAVKVSRVDQRKQVKSISNFESHNHSLLSRVKILCVSLRVKALKRG
jgi:hypothetical protein